MSTTTEHLRNCDDFGCLDEAHIAAQDAPLPGVSLDDPDLTRAVAEAIHDAHCHESCHTPCDTDRARAVAALAAVRAHLEEVGR